MTINPQIFKAYDIRGVYPSDINEENFSTIIKAIYTFFNQEVKKDSLKVCLGSDMRLSSPVLFRVAKETLLKLGAHILDVDLVSTPTFYFACLHHQADCGIQISASHNPPQWNGAKFVIRRGKNLIKIGKNTGMKKILELVEKGKFIEEKNNGKITKIKTPVIDEINFAFDYVKPSYFKKLKIVADPANAMGISYLEELFKRLPCQLVKMNFTLDGSFPAHEPNPLIFKNLIDLQKKVIEEKADLGIAPDGDGDRVFFIDEKGKIIQASLISSLIATELLKKNPGDKIGLDIRYTRNIINAVKKANGKPIVGPVGHALISELMIKEDILFTGESSGHYFYRATGYAESSVITILQILKVISEQNKPISQITSQYESSIESGEINFTNPANVLAKDFLKKISEDYHDADISWLDGLSVDYPNWRFNIRASNTEPLIRLNVEGNTQELVKEKTKELKMKILALGASEKN